MMLSRYKMFMALAIVCTAIACNKVPDHIIQPDDMAQLLADIHIGETVVESNFADYPTDSARMLMKQSIVARHGYTLAQLDTSFVWYGQHLDVFQEVYDKTVSILETRIAEAGAGEAEMRRKEMGGDSVDVWPGVQRYVLRPGIAPSDYITYSIARDADWKPGDMFTIRAKFTNSPALLRWSLSADYSDGSVEVLNLRFSGDGWHEMTFFTDSTRTANHIYGSLQVVPEARGTVFIDSVQLVRKPLVPRIYPQRYRQRAYSYFNQGM